MSLLAVLWALTLFGLTSSTYRRDWSDQPGAGAAIWIGAYIGEASKYALWIGASFVALHFIIKFW